MVRYLAVAFFPLAVLYTSVAVQAQTLSEAMQNALNVHPQIQAGVNSRLSVEKQMRAAEGGYLPNVNLLAGYGREATSSPTSRRDYNDNKYQWLSRGESNLQVRQMLFDGFLTESEVGRQRATVNSRAYELLGRSEQVALKVTEAYLDVLKRQSMVDLAQRNLKAHERIYELIRARKESGVGLSADLDQADARLAQARNNLLTEETNLADAKVAYRSVVGSEPDQLTVPTGISSSLPQSLVDARRKLVASNPLLRSAESDVQATKHQYDAAKSKFYPRFDAEVGAAADNNLGGLRGHYNKGEAMVRMRYNLYAGGSDMADVESKAFQINEAMDIRNNALRVLNEELGLAWNAWQSAREQLPIAQKYVNYSAKVRELYQKQFMLGQRTLLDLLDSENELFTASLRLEDVRFTELFNQYRVEATMGSLLRTEGIAAPMAATPLDEVTTSVQLPKM